MSAYDFTLTALSGQPLPLSAYRGRTLLIANTASRCGFTAQYQGLQRLAERYTPQGLTVIGVPSNDFAGQEPKTNSAIASFCERNYGVSFPLAAKTVVRGRAAHPLFQWLRHELGPAAGPWWNFYKFLIAPDGRAVDWFSPLTTPDSPRLHTALERIMS
jgi:glutathione peroxidase